MEKIVNYVYRGKGVGLLFILAASVLVTIVMLIVGKNFYGEMRPQMMLVANDFLPITVENGKIVSPADTYKRVNLDLGGKDNFSVVLNTREDAGGLPRNESGIFVYRDAIYVVSPNQIRNYNLQDGMWDSTQFEQLLDQLSGIIFGVAGVVLIFVLFIVCLIKTVGAALLGALAQRILGKKDALPMSSLMRLCAVLVSGVEVIRWIAISSGATLTGMTVFALVVVLELVFVFKTQTVEE